MVISWMWEYEVDWIGVEICGNLMVFVLVFVKIFNGVVWIDNVYVEFNLVIVYMFIINLFYVNKVDNLFLIYLNI